MDTTREERFKNAIRRSQEVQACYWCGGTEDVQLASYRPGPQGLYVYARWACCRARNPQGYRG
jgi:hypothetical protein